MELEETLNNSKPVAKIIEKPIDLELEIVIKPIENQMVSQNNDTSISPMDMTIEQTLKLKNEERIKKLKEHNYKFKNNSSSIDDLEKEPAYKRSGIDLTEPDFNNKNSRISLGTDSNNEIQVRSNNSFLHDNVD
jgi:cell division protein FtsZ